MNTVITELRAKVYNESWQLRTRADAPIVTDRNWLDKAACQGHPTEWWYPPPGDNTYRHAKPICARCPARTECLNTAMTLEQGLWIRYRFGMWGGLSPHQRAMKDPTRARRGPIGDGRPVPVCGTESGYQAHRRRNETACDACRAAHAATIADYRATARKSA